MIIVFDLASSKLSAFTSESEEGIFQVCIVLQLILGLRGVYFIIHQPINTFGGYWYILIRIT